MNNFSYSAAGLALAKSFEGLKLTAYKDSGGVWTLGWGHVLGVSLGDSCTEAQADQWLSEDLQVAEHAVNTLVTVPLNQNQYDALVDFTFNLGVGSLKSSTLLSLLNQGAYAGASAQILRWDNVNGVVNPGLTRRRIAEKKLFDTETI
jgi:lysozyme